MPAYRVKFFKNLVSSDGHPFKCLQRVVDVRNCKSPERAVQAAKHRFRRAEHVIDWKLHADTLETEVEPAKLPLVKPAVRRAKKRK